MSSKPLIFDPRLAEMKPRAGTSTAIIGFRPTSPAPAAAPPAAATDDPDWSDYGGRRSPPKRRQRRPKAR